jgi:hypothetical protein
MVIARLQQELVAVEPDPGDVAGAVGEPAFFAMAMRTPFAGKIHLKLDSAAQAPSPDCLRFIHGFLLNTSKCMWPA